MIIYKIVTKGLTNSFKQIFLIPENRFAFVPNQNIHNNAFMAIESIHAINQMNCGIFWGSYNKLDMNKAYDGIEWNFLHVILYKTRFLENFFTIILDCIPRTLVSTSIDPTLICAAYEGVETRMPNLSIYCLSCAQKHYRVQLKLERLEKWCEFQWTSSLPKLNMLLQCNYVIMVVESIPQKTNNQFNIVIDCNLINEK